MVRGDIDQPEAGPDCSHELGTAWRVGKGKAGQGIRKVDLDSRHRATRTNRAPAV